MYCMSHNGHKTLFITEHITELWKSINDDILGGPIVQFPASKGELILFYLYFIVRYKKESKKPSRAP